MKISVEESDWKNAALNARYLAEFWMLRGSLDEALQFGQKSAEYAKRWGKNFEIIASMTTCAKALFLQGRLSESESEFQEAEQFLQSSDANQRFLYFFPGTRYCALLLAQKRFEEVYTRVKVTLPLAEDRGSKYYVAMEHVRRGQAYLGQAAMGEPHKLSLAQKDLEEAVSLLRLSGEQDKLPRGLLARAQLYRITHRFKEARRDLDESLELAMGCGMRLTEADSHIEYSRLKLEAVKQGANLDASFFSEANLTAQEHFMRAEKLVRENSYHRRDSELELLQKELQL